MSTGTNSPQSPPSPRDALLAIPLILVGLPAAAGPMVALFGQISALTGDDLSRVPGPPPAPGTELVVGAICLTDTAVVLVAFLAGRFLDAATATMVCRLYAAISALTLGLALFNPEMRQVEHGPLLMAPMFLVLVLALAGALFLPRRVPDPERPEQEQTAQDSP